ncbi:MAG: DUF7662 domain-containing protein [Frankiaceae bacterium]
MAKYDPLGRWLSAQRDRSEITLSFADIERLIGDGLPASAHRHQAWWANDASHVQASVWLAAGWAVDTADPTARRVRFLRSR